LADLADKMVENLPNMDMVANMAAVVAAVNQHTTVGMRLVVMALLDYYGDLEVSLIMLVHQHRNLNIKGLLW
jgi:hypothetical protein